MDYASILGAKIEPSKQLSVNFEISFLSPRYFVTPAFFTIELDDNTQNAGLATYGCGMLNQNGEFCIENSKNCVFPEFDSDWAVLCSCRFGDLGLGNWMPHNRR